MRLSDLEFTGLKTAVLAAAVLGLAACGGGGGGGGGSTGISELKQGVVQGLGSICVGGVKYDDSSASHQSDDNQPIQPGMVVTLKTSNVQSGSGTCTDDEGNTITVSQVGTATAVFYEDELEGQATIVDRTTPTTGRPTGSFTVFGVTITVDENTVFDDFTADSLDVEDYSDMTSGDFVEVSGMPSGTGTILATRVEKKDAGDTESELKGTVGNLVLNTSFDLTIAVGIVVPVTYSDNMVEGGPISEGAYVEVEGTDNAGTLVASKVEIEDDHFEAEHGAEDHAEFEGLAANVPTTRDSNNAPDPLEFDIPLPSGAMLHVDATGADFENGSAADLVDGVRVKVEGNIDNASGNLVATKVEFHDGRIEITATVTVSGADVSILGLPLVTDPMSELRDTSANGGGSITLAQLSNGDYVELRARANGNGELVISRLEVEISAEDTVPANSKIELRGTVTAKSATSVTILGIEVDLSSATELQNQNEQPVADVGAFLGLVTEGVTIVEAEGDGLASFDAGPPATLTAKKAEIEGEDHSDDD